MHHLVAREGQGRARDLRRTNRPASVIRRDIARFYFGHLLAASEMEGH
jgi:hypothetical protein